ncbi:MAG: polyprenyl synthetase family protein [bacterium]|nr:polyprenyl synthetase family protein [bacterium]
MKKNPIKETGDLKEYIEQSLHEILRNDSSPIAELIRYSVLSKSKRLRPMFICSIAELLGKPRESVIQAACAIEIIHSASLILDDLPCMDNAAFRRGQPASHIAFGEANVILAAHIMTYNAYDLIIQNAVTNGLEAKTISAISSLLNSLTGIDGVIGGQFDDIHNTAGEAPLNSNALEEMYRKKTSMLFELAAAVAGLLAGATPGEIENLKQYACRLGLAFQILDDILDSTCSLEDMGKDPNLDDGKPTFVNLLGIHAAADRITEHLEAAASYIGKFYNNTDYFNVILQNLDATLNSCLDNFEKTA